MVAPRTPASSETPQVLNRLCQPEMEVQLRQQALEALEPLRALVDHCSKLDLAVGPPKGDGHLQEKLHLVDWKTFWKDKLRDLCIPVFRTHQADDLTCVETTLNLTNV